MRSTRSAGVVVASVLAVVGCSGSSADEVGIASRPVPHPFAPSSVPAPEGTVVTSEASVYGEWILTRVAGRAAPKGPDPRLSLIGGGRGPDDFSAAYWVVGCNDEAVAWRIDDDGRYARGEMTSTAVGCGHDALESGYGVALAAQLRLTAAGELVYVDDAGHELAAYVRSDAG